jgi:hypothetical protein
MRRPAEHHLSVALKRRKRRRLEDLALLLKPAVLAPQPARVLALVAAQPVAALRSTWLRVSAGCLPFNGFALRGRFG